MVAWMQVKGRLPRLRPWNAEREPSRVLLVVAVLGASG